MRIISILLLKMAAVIFSAWLLPGVTFEGIITVFWLVIVLVPIDFIFKPIIHLLSLPITIMTLGLFALVINGLMVLLASFLVPGFEINGFFTAIIFSLILGITTAILQKIFQKKIVNSDKERG